MQALSDEQQLERLERKVDAGFAETRAQITHSELALRSEIVAARSDARADFRTLIAVTFAMWVTTILTVVGVQLQHYL